MILRYALLSKILGEEFKYLNFRNWRIYDTFLKEGLILLDTDAFISGNLVDYNYMINGDIAKSVITNTNFENCEIYNSILIDCDLNNSVICQSYLESCSIFNDSKLIDCKSTFKNNYGPNNPNPSIFNISSCNWGDCFVDDSVQVESENDWPNDVFCEFERLKYLAESYRPDKFFRSKGIYSETY